MPDLTIEFYEMCSQLDWHNAQWNVGGYQQSIDPRTGELECTCKGYRFHHKCKHIREVELIRCSWHGAYDEAQKEKGICPRCGGPTIVVKVGV